MASAKKEASESLAKLAHWLQRDAHGLELLASVEKFVAELRRERTTLREAAESSERGARQAREHAIEQSNTATKIRQELAICQSRSAQLQIQLSRCEEENGKLKREKTDDAIVYESDDPEIQDVARQMSKMINELRESFGRSAPKPVKSIKANAYDASAFIRNFTGAEMRRLGMFVATMLCITGSVGLFLDEASGLMVANRKKLSDDDRRMEKIVIWFRSNISRGRTEFERACYAPTQNERVASDTARFRASTF